jgi:uncharacterized protein YlxW (UPF0749 family)
VGWRVANDPEPDALNTLFTKEITMKTFALKLLEEKRELCLVWRNEASSRRLVAQQRMTAEQARMNELDKEIHDLGKAIDSLTYSTNKDQS